MNSIGFGRCILLLAGSNGKTPLQILIRIINEDRDAILYKQAVWSSIPYRKLLNNIEQQAFASVPSAVYRACVNVIMEDEFDVFKRYDSPIIPLYDDPIFKRYKLFRLHLTIIFSEGSI